MRPNSFCDWLEITEAFLLKLVSPFFWPGLGSLSLGLVELDLPLIFATFSNRLIFVFWTPIIAAATLLRLVEPSEFLAGGISLVEPGGSFRGSSEVKESTLLWLLGMLECEELSFLWEGLEEALLRSPLLWGSSFSSSRLAWNWLGAPFSTRGVVSIDLNCCNLYVPLRESIFGRDVE